MSNIMMKYYTTGLKCSKLRLRGYLIIKAIIEHIN